MSIGERILDLLDTASYRLPSGLVRFLSIPIGFQLNARDGFMHENARMIATAFSYIANNKLRGDYAEFGVMRGKGIIDAHYSARWYALDEMRLWAFDSFRGLPEIKGIDVGGPFSKGEFACARMDFERNLRRHAVDMERVKVVEGFYSETLAPGRFEAGIPRICIAYIDCDLYESTVPVLDFLTHRLVDGAIVIFDDWYCFNGRPDKGEQKGCAEWVSANPQISLTEYREFHWAGKSFIFHRSS